MRLIKFFNFTIFVVFFILITKNYFSKNFLNNKLGSRENYELFLNNKIEKIITIKSKKNFKKFNNNSKYFKKNEEDKEFWKLLKTK